jgi:hypothetical protein
MYRYIKLADQHIEQAAKGLVAGGGKAGGAYRAPAKLSESSAPLAKRYSDAVEHVGRLRSDPNAVIAAMTAKPIGSAPKTSVALSMSAAKSLAYLMTAEPKNLNRQALGAADRPPRASMQDMVKFTQTYDAVTDPQSVMQKLASTGRISHNEADAIRETSPKLWLELQQKVYDEVATRKAEGKPLSHNERLKLGIVLGIDTDPALDRATSQRLQSSLLAGVKKEDGGPAGPSRPVRIEKQDLGFDALETGK